MVLDAGAVKEFDNPQTLMAKHDSLFYGMCKEAGLIDATKL
jgi:ABC-type multidrug transport system fused ATPase/permease subunit